MSAQVNMHDAKSQLSALVNRVLQGEQITITRAGKPAVDFGFCWRRSPPGA